MVYATLRVPLADVLNSQPQAPAYQVQVPEGFQPGHAIRQSTNGNPIGLNAHTVLDLNATFDVQVGPDGDLRFSVRSEGGAGDAAGLWVEARTVWPLRGTQPRVCARNIYTQQRIVQVVRDQGHGSITCDDVTWQHLSAIHTLHDFHVRSGQVWELYGLTGLKTAKLSCSSDDKELVDLHNMLAQMPNLERLSYRCDHLEEWLLRALASAPNLVDLTVDAGKLVDLPSGWLDRQSRLTTLKFVAPRLSTAPAWLSAVPGLRSLDLHVASLEGLTVDWLQYTPLLTRLHLEGTGWSPLPGRWLAHVRGLVDLSLSYPETSGPHSSASPISADLLAYTPGLTRLRLSNVIEQLPVGGFDRTQVRELTLIPRQAEALPVGFRIPTSLTHLRYFSGQELLPPGFLTHTSQLAHVEMELLNLTALPDDFLAYTPHLTHVSLLTPQLTALPPRFLAQAPQLEELELTHLGAGMPLTLALTALPAGFLAHTPRLTRLKLNPSRVTTLPEGFLAHTPRLVEAVLFFPDANALPAGFLSHTPRLQHLTLEANRSAALPEGFLAHAPHLRYLHLRLFGLGPAVPPGFLQHVPALVQLYLWAEKLTALPVHFLQDVPRLRKLHLWLPQLDPPPAPGEALWLLLQVHSEWRRAAGSDTPLYGQPDARDDQVVLTIPAGTRLRVVARIRDRDGQEWLKVLPHERYLYEADLLHMWGLPGWLPSSLTEPSIQDRCVGEYLCYYPGGPGG